MSVEMDYKPPECETTKHQPKLLHEYTIDDYTNEYKKLAERPHSLIVSSEIPRLDATQVKEINGVINLDDQKDFYKIDSIKDAQVHLDILINNSSKTDISDKDISVALKLLSEWAKNSYENQILLLRNLLSTEVNLSTLVLISDIYQNEDHAYFAKEIEEQLIKYLDKANLSPSMINQISTLNRGNDTDSRVALHKIIDFMKYHSQNVQNLIPQESKKFQNRFLTDFNNLASQEIVFSQNYLIQKNFYDFLKSGFQLEPAEKGSLAGVPGGNLDESIFAFSKLDASYQNRLALNINEGYPATNSVIPISPDYFGYYQKGKVTKVFNSQNLENSTSSQRVGEYINNNDPKYDYIYDEINKPQVYEHGSHKLRKLHILKQFDDLLKNDNNIFFYDVSKIKSDQLHSIVYNNILAHNQQYLDKIEGKTNKSQETSHEQFEKLLFPYNKKGSNKELILYKQLSSLHMRKKIEDDFGINIANFDFATQRNFLEFLEAKTTLDAKQLMKFTKKFGDNAFKSFLSLEHGQEMGEKILAIGKKLDPESANAVFAKYSDIIDSTEKVRQIIVETTKRPQDTQVTINKITETLLMRGKDLLVYFGDHADQVNSEEILEELGKINSDILLFSTIYKVTKPELKDIEGVLLESVNSSELNDDDKKQMVKIASNNITRKEFGKKVVLSSLENSFSNPSNRFYILKKDGRIISFMRFEDKDDQTYFGSFNVDYSARSAGFGNEMMVQALNQESQNKPIIANVEVDIPVASKYINEMGFVVTKILPNVAGTGVNGFELTRDNQANKLYQSKKSVVDLEKLKINRADQEYQTQPDILFYEFDLKTEQNQFIQVTQNLLGNPEFSVFF